ncbi:unnamed protein product [Onchocerca flexuosa]|uniref:E3 ubiquitin-protein ligase Topors n=1 Tax=Onchocerca flexuosa TaxID=387005 RepID=A0A183I559_9BILA|nr:unnamed protein product [Onchocerca flexuosa]
MNECFRTIDTLSVPLSLSVPTGESEQNTDEEGTTSSNDPSSGYSKRTTSNTSADFSSFKNLSKISEHTTMHLRPDDLEWMNDVRQYQESEPVFRKKPFNAALKIRPRKVFPRLKWRHLYHQWALRQSPKTYMGIFRNFIIKLIAKSIGKDVLNPYINRILEKKYDDVDLNSSDLEHGIFYLKCTNC